MTKIKQDYLRLSELDNKLCKGTITGEERFERNRILIDEDHRFVEHAPEMLAILENCLDQLIHIKNDTNQDEELSKHTDLNIKAINEILLKVRG